MPFIQRVVEPKYLSRTSLQNENGEPLVTDSELEAVTNNTLSNALRQLASLVLVANDIFTELTKELQKVSERSSTLKVKIGLVDGKLCGYDPKKVPVPEGDISTFALLRSHYTRPQEPATGLFGAESRPMALRALYAAAARTPVHAMRQMDRWRRDGHRTSRFFLCTPVLGAKRRKIRSRVDIDIETRMPAAVGELRRWTSSEAIGDVTVTTDCVNRITSNSTVEEVDAIDTGVIFGDDEAIDHKLPSPEEQLQVLALKFPAEIVSVDVSGRRFDRLSVQRRSLLHADTVCEEDASGTVRRRTRTRKPRGKRRNTLAGIDQKEIRDALTAGDEPTSTILLDESESPDISPVIRSRSTDILRSKKSSPPDGKKSHFNTLKQWGKSRLKLINRSSDSKAETSKIDDIDDVNIYETITMRRRRNIDKETKPTHERKTSYSSSEKSSSISLPISTPLSAAMNIAVKLRESSAVRRQRRNKDEQHSSSGNWSASSESGRASIGSEITSTTHPKSTTSTATSNNSLGGPPSSVHSRRRFPPSASSSVTSEGTLTPDIIHDIQDDGETSSVYSCDTEGYYTSFHMDSGLKTLKEEELGLPITPLHSTSAFSNSSGNFTVLTAENEYELFGKGSTSTTTSSAGTVCTTLRASESHRSLVVGPVVPERKSSLNYSDRSANNSLEREFSSDKTGTVKRSPASSNKATVVAVVHKQSSGDISPDSGHNTSSSPIESVSSPNGPPSSSEFEFSESSDLEGVERIERIRIKTAINSSRIPSMCVITPPHSDDESVQSVDHNKFRKTNEKTGDNNSTKNNLNIPDLGSKNASRPKLNLPLQPTETDLDTLIYVDSETNDCNPSQKSRLVLTPINGSNKMQLINVNPTSGYATVETLDSKSGANKTDKPATEVNTKAPSPSGGCVIINENPLGTKSSKSPPNQPIIKATLMPLNNMFGKLKSNFSNLASRKEKPPAQKDIKNPDNLFDSGDYVTIADVRNNNEKASITNNEVLYANDVVKKPEVKPQTIQKIRETEYVSLNELPIQNSDNNSNSTGSATNSLERNRRHGARVTLDAEGKVVYSSDSLKRRKGAHTTFEPGPFVKDMTTPTASPLPVHRTPRTIRPVNSNQDKNRNVATPTCDARPLSPQLNKVVIRANLNSSPTADCVRMPPATIVTPSARPATRGGAGAYVHMQEDRGRSLLPALEEERALSPSRNHQIMHPQTADRYYHRESPIEYQQHLHNNDGFLMQRNSPLYRTLPSRISHSYQAAEQQTRAPDITRGLTSQQLFTKQNDRESDIYNRENYKFSSLPRRQFIQKPDMSQYNARIGQPVSHFQQQNTVIYNSQVPSYGNHNQVPSHIDKNLQRYHNSTPTKIESNSSRIPVGIGNFFSPISKNKEQQTIHNESLKISPIDPRNTGGFQSSTPSKAKELTSAVNLSNKMLSPKKSTMSNEELYAMIHKSKKKLNIKTDDIDRGSPVSSVSNLSPSSSIMSLSGRSTPVKQPETGYIGEARNRNSWSPNNDNNVLSTEPGFRQSWACSDRVGLKQTSRLDFKKLLLQHGSKSNIIPKSNNKLSAVEQLKLSKSQSPVVKQPPAMNILDLSASPRSLVNRKLANVAPNSPEKQRPPSKLLSPRSNWKFANPRSDVLSSTILEDCREDESPHNSLDKSNSCKRSPVTQSQNSIARSNTNLVADNRYSKAGLQENYQNDKSVSRTQLIQAQRAEFFKNSSNRSPTNTATSFSNRNAVRKSPSPPTLETAL